MARPNSIPDYDFSLVYESESAVDMSFRRIRLSHSKLLRHVSHSHEKHIRKILEEKRREEAVSNDKSFLYRTKQRVKLYPTTTPTPPVVIKSDNFQEIELSSEDERNTSQRASPSVYEQQMTPNRSMDDIVFSTDSEKADSSANRSGFMLSPYKKKQKTYNFSTSKRKGPREPPVYPDDIYKDDEGLKKRLARGEITKYQCRQRYLAKSNRVNYICLDDMEPSKEKRTTTSALYTQKVKNRIHFPSPHYKTQKKVINHSSSKVAFKPHKVEDTGTSRSTATPKPHLDDSLSYNIEETTPPKRLFNQIKLSDSTYRQSQSLDRTKCAYGRPQFRVNSRPTTAGVSLGGGGPLKNPDLRHGGRLSAQNMLNYIHESIATPMQSNPVSKTFDADQTLDYNVITAVRKAQKRVSTDKAKIMQKNHDRRMNALSSLVRSTNRTPTKATPFEVTLDIPHQL